MATSYELKQLQSPFRAARSLRIRLRWFLPALKAMRP